MGRKRGQVAIEYTVLIGLLLFFFVPLIHFAYTEVTMEVRNSQLESYLGRLSKAIDAVHTIGPGSQEKIVITAPHGVQAAFLVNQGPDHEILLQVNSQSGTSDWPATVKPYVFSDIPSGTPGRYLIPNISGTYHLRITGYNETAVNVSVR